MLQLDRRFASRCGRACEALRGVAELEAQVRPGRGACLTYAPRVCSCVGRVPPPPAHAVVACVDRAVEAALATEPREVVAVGVGVGVGVGVAWRWRWRWRWRW